MRKRFSKRIRNIFICMCVLVLWIPIVIAAEGTSYNLYFGDLHTHTSYSDGRGTPADAYTAARAAGADFLAVTDHNYILKDDEWLDMKTTAEEHTSETFVAMAAWEYCLAGFGEMNLHDINHIEIVMNSGFHKGGRKEGPANFYDWLKETDAIAQWNHPIWYTDNFDNYDYWSETRDEAISMHEIFNNGKWLSYGDLNYEPSFIMALDAGWHMMPAANSDTHTDNWISGYDSRTVLLAPNLTREDLYDAMRARRGYATQDKNLCVFYTLNGEVMGSILSPASSYTADIQIWDPDVVADDLNDAITLIEIVSDGGGVVASLPLDPEASLETINWTVPLTVENARFFYVRISTASDISGTEGVTAWTAPVWTGR